MANAESALTEAWEAEVKHMQAAGEARLEELEVETARLRMQMDDARRAEQDTVCARAEDGGGKHLGS